MPSPSVFQDQKAEVAAMERIMKRPITLVWRDLVNTQSQIFCPHGGQVSVEKVAPIAICTEDDKFHVSGCPTSNPCKSVRWIVYSPGRALVGRKLLDQTSIGLCCTRNNLPTGTAVITRV